MKKSMALLILLFGASTFAANLKTEIICRAPARIGCDYLELRLQSYPSGNVKNVAVYKGSWGGLQLAANIKVPAKPKIDYYDKGFISEEFHTYKGKGLVFEIRILKMNGDPLNGGSVKLSLPGFQPESTPLHCDKVD